MTPEEIAATFRTPIRRHAWQDPKWLGAGAAALALLIGLGAYFYPKDVDESDWTPASTRGLVEQRGSTRNPQAILDGGPTGTAARDPQAILDGEPTNAGPAATPASPSVIEPPDSTVRGADAGRPATADDAVAPTGSAASTTTAPAPALAPTPLTPSAEVPNAAPANTACTATVQALGLCAAP